jgi:hypothetical protein
MSATASDRAHVSIRSRSMWRLRVGRELPRLIVGGVAVLGLVASARLAISPPSSVRASTAPARSADRGAEGYAVLFARRYLTWSALDPSSRTEALQGFRGGAVEGDAGVVLPAKGSETVEWAEVVQAREPTAGEHVYTVAAETSALGLQYLTVAVTRLSGGLELSGYPAFVGAPATAAADGHGRLIPVGDPSLQVVVRRALANYLAGSLSELSADLSAGARVAMPRVSLQLLELVSLSWSADRRSVLALLTASDPHGVRYTLEYEADVLRIQGRWEIAAIQTDPNA